jgi:hypothetical protein
LFQLRLDLNCADRKSKMEMDDDFMGEVEFDLSPEQGEVVSRAIGLAASRRGDDFAHINPLIVIMQWWQVNVADAERIGATPEATLTEACRRYIAANSP